MDRPTDNFIISNNIVVQSMLSSPKTNNDDCGVDSDGIIDNLNGGSDFISGCDGDKALEKPLYTSKNIPKHDGNISVNGGGGGGGVGGGGVIIDSDGDVRNIGVNGGIDKNREPPDGGTRAWLVVISAFLCNSILFGIINTYGIIYITLQEKLAIHGDTGASSKAALVGSLTIGTTFLLSPVSGILTDKIGLRKTTFMGGILCASGMFLSAIFVTNIYALYITYGIMFGLGAAFAYTPTLAILGHYFQKYLGLVNGFVTSGSSVCTAILPFGLDYLLKNYNLSVTFCTFAVFSLFIIVCAFIYKPVRLASTYSNGSKLSLAHTGEINNGTTTSSPSRYRRKQKFLRSLINVDNWKKPRYIIWAVSIPIALIGYFVPYVHMAKFVKITYPGTNENFPIICIGITSGIGRLLFGYIADLKGINRIYLQQISFLIMGILTMAIPLTTSYELLIVICLTMGLVDGCFISLLGPIAYDICGPNGATQAIGFLLGLCSIPLTIGPPVAGILYDHTKSYVLSFILAGIPAIIGATMMCSMKFIDGAGSSNGNHRNDSTNNGIRRRPKTIEDAEELEPIPAWKLDKSRDIHTSSTIYQKDTLINESGVCKNV